MIEHERAKKQIVSDRIVFDQYSKGEIDVIPKDVKSQEWWKGYILGVEYSRKIIKE